MRLIDADALIEAMKKTESEYENAMTCPSWWSAFNVISEQPTAYSVNEVVEELEETMQDLSVIEILSHIDFDSTIQSGLDNFLKAYNSELLRIVKNGGVSDDVCEWKYKDSEYYFESSCEHLHIFMSDGPKENEYRFCPYCGKKIKVVE